MENSNFPCPTTLFGLSPFWKTGGKPSDLMWTDCGKLFPCRPMPQKKFAELLFLLFQKFSTGLFPVENLLFRRILPKIVNFSTTVAHILSTSVFPLKIKPFSNPSPHRFSPSSIGFATTFPQVLKTMWKSGFSWGKFHSAFVLPLPPRYLSSKDLLKKTKRLPDNFFF